MVRAKVKLSEDVRLRRGGVVQMGRVIVRLGRSAFRKAQGDVDSRNNWAASRGRDLMILGGHAWIGVDARRKGWPGEQRRQRDGTAAGKDLQVGDARR